jgi:hypothetical protein
VAVYNATRSKKPPGHKKTMVAAWYQRNKNHVAGYYADYRHAIREEMVIAYGGCCIECGEADPIVLVLDHVNDDAPQDRRENGHKGGYKLYMQLRAANWPKSRYQLLCQNCNFRKEYRRRKNAVQIRRST